MHRSMSDRFPLLALGLALACAVPAFGEALREHRDTPASAFAPGVLKEAIGVLSVVFLPRDDDAGPAALPSYRETPRGWVEDGSIPLAELRPVSHCGYSGEPALGGRFPVLAVRGDRVLVAWDPVGDRRAWVKPEEIDARWSAGVNQFNPAAGDGDEAGEFVDPFFFLPPGHGRRFHEGPGEGSRPFSLWRGQRGPFVVMERRGDWLRLGEAGLGDEPRSVGWIRLRDGQGRLSVWVECVDLC